MTENGTLTTKQARAVAALLTAPTTSEAAKLAGVGERTLWTWLGDSVFQAALQREQDAVIAGAVRGLVGELAKSHQVMRTLRDGDDSAPSLKLRAARALDESTLRWLELASVLKRLDALETAISELPQ